MVGVEGGFGVKRGHTVVMTGRAGSFKGPPPLHTEFRES